jgi:hypothetical protein
MERRDGMCWFGNKRKDLMTTSISIADLGWVHGFMLYRHDGRYPQDGDGTGRFPLDSYHMGAIYFCRDHDLIDYTFHVSGVQ